MQIDERTIREAADQRILSAGPDENDDQVRAHFNAGVALAQSIRTSLAGPAAALVEVERLDHLQNGFDAAHDDKETWQRLAIASALYIAEGTGLKIADSDKAWPWPKGGYPDRRGQIDDIRRLIIGASLALAEADRLIRLRDKESGVANG